MSIKAIETDPVPPDMYAGIWMNYDDGKDTVHRFKAGDVMRSSNSFHAFSDAVIAGFDNKGNTKLFRPYLYVSSVGTTGPTALVGHEVIDYVSPQSLVQHWIKVDTGRTL